METFLPFLIPAMIGLGMFAALPAFSLAFSSGAPRGDATVSESCSAARYRFAASVLVLVAQMVLLRYFGYASSTALGFMLMLLSAVAVSANAYLKGWKAGLAAAGIYFAVFVLYWAMEKYLFAPSIFDWASSLSPKVSDLTAPMKLLALAGVSYIGFKLIHFMSDLYSGEIEEVEPIEFISWLLFFPSIVAGPMMRFQDWVSQRGNASIDFNWIVEGVRRIAIGLFMKLAIADVISGGTIAQMTQAQLAQASAWQVAQGCALYTVFLFFDFAGYSHIAIGAGLFWGIRLPENFDKPYVARNLAEFWNRWHISLSTILRDYLYYPLTLAIKRSPVFKGRVMAATMLSPFLTFLAAGVWHGAGVNFIIYGALHGIGLGIVAVLKQRRRKGAFALWWEKSLAGRIGGIALNFAYVSFTFLFFALPWSSLSILLHRMVS